MSIEYKGWKLVTHQDEDTDGFIRYEHYAMNGSQTKHLHGSSFLTNFWPTREVFEYLVDHDFPRAPKGNWYTHELKELIEGEKSCRPE